MSKSLSRLPPAQMLIADLLVLFQSQMHEFPADAVSDRDQAIAEFSANVLTLTGETPPLEFFTSKSPEENLTTTIRFLRNGKPFAAAEAHTIEQFARCLEEWFVGLGKPQPHPIAVESDLQG